jgi:uncharacterized protein
LTELLRKRLYELYAAYAAGRIDEVLREYDDNVTMTSYAPVDIFPYLGRKQGKTAVAATMTVARLRQRVTGRIIQLFIADFIRFDKGRIVELRQFMDSFDAVQQVLGREILISKTPE